MSAIGITDIAGTSGGTTFSKQGGGNYVRRRVRPTNPKSAAQVAQRAKFSQQSQAWRGLTDAERAAWNAAAKSGEFPFKTLLGDSFNGSGSQAFSAVNNMVVAAGGAALTAPPVKVGLGDVLVSSMSVDTTLGTFTITYSGTIGADEVLMVSATIGVSPGRRRPTNLKLVDLLLAADTSPADIQAAYVALFGLPSTGQRYIIRARLVNKVTGEFRDAGGADAIATA